MRNKYIVAKNNYIQIEEIFIFASTINHKDMFQAVKSLGYDEIVSAGSIDEFMQCFGESFTLNVRTRGNMDTTLLHRMLEIEDKQLRFKK